MGVLPHRNGRRDRRLSLRAAVQGLRRDGQHRRRRFARCDRGRRVRAPRSSACSLAAPACRPAPLRRRRLLHVHVSRSAGWRGRLPLGRGRDLPLGLSTARRRADAAGASPRPASPRPCGRPRLARPDARLRAAFLGLPDRAERPHGRAHGPGKGRVDRVPTRRCAAARRDHPLCGSGRHEDTVVLSPLRRHRVAARHGLRVQLRAPPQQLPPPGHLRPRLARLPRALGCRCVASLDARARRGVRGAAGQTDDNTPRRSSRLRA